MAAECRCEMKRLSMVMRNRSSSSSSSGGTGYTARNSDATVRKQTGIVSEKEEESAPGRQKRAD